MSGTVDRFIAFLSEKVPATRTFLGRSSLLDGIVDETGYHRDEHNMSVDLELIVRRLRADRSALRRFVENASGHLPEHERDELELHAAAIWTKPAVPALDLGATHRFDLHTVVEACLPRIRRQRGVIGFTMHCTCDPLVTNLIERIKDEMRVFSDPRARYMNMVDGLRSVPTALAQIGRLRDTLRVQDVICSVVVIDAATAATLWQGACKLLGGVWANRFVLFAMIRQPCIPPPGMTHLQTPEFQYSHAATWWRELMMVQGWRGVGLSRILQTFGNTDAQDEEFLDMDVVYEDLADAMALLKDHGDEELFCAAWTARRMGVG